jgi:hypothetical protein
MPGPGNQKKPSKRKVVASVMPVASSTSGNMTMALNTSVLASASEIGRFCNPANPPACATVRNDLLCKLLFGVLEKGRKEGFDNGRSYGCEEGYSEGLQASLERHENDVFEQLKKEDEQKAQDDAYKEGKVHGQLEERTNWVLNHGEGLCGSLEVSTS